MLLHFAVTRVSVFDGFAEVYTARLALVVRESGPLAIGRDAAELHRFRTVRALEFSFFDHDTHAIFIGANRTF